MKWTDKQREAIEIRDKNILVAAAAGSGKTAVLVERIKQLIIEDCVSIDKMLIVTFTNAAASEMKEKIVNAIVKQIASAPDKTKSLRRQLEIIYKANISTFHAFALEVIRRYFYVIDIDPSFRICDEAEGEILRNQAVDLLFEEYFEKKDLRFCDFLDRYSGSKSFENVKQMVINSYNKLQSIPEPYTWLEEHIDKFNCTEDEFRKSQTYSIMMSEIISSLQNAGEVYSRVVELLEEEGCDKMAIKVLQEKEACINAAQKAKEDGYDAALEAMGMLPTVRLTASKDEKESYNRIKETVKELRSHASESVKKLKANFFAYSLPEYVSELNEVYPSAITFGDMILRYRDIYKEQKQEKNVIDFSDIEHYALEILKDESVADEYRKKFEYIFIDEYQDSNLIQETLISRIKRENNLFMVGDVKQSIYKFRLAEPELFMKKYEEFRVGKGRYNTKIDLNMNFRSKGGVISFTNELFSASMPGYDDNAALYKGLSYVGPSDYEAELHILCKGDEEAYIPEEIQELKNAEKEAIVAAKLIKDNIGKTIYDAKKEEERSLKKRDIVVLMRATKNTADIFRKIFAEFNIDTYIEDNDGYFDTIEIEIFINLLRVIDNKRRDVPLISVLHSAIFDFSPDELAEVRLSQRKGSYFDALNNYSEGDTELASKCRNALKRIEEWKSFSNAMRLPELIWRIMQDTGLYIYIGAMPAGAQRLANLRAMIDKAEAFASNHSGGIYEFLAHIEKMRSRKVAVPQVKLISENDDVVRIMTVHKSKGLEFPVVIVAGLGKRFNRSRGEKLTLHKDIGMGLTLSNCEEHWRKKTITQKLIELKQQKEESDEELRILYVACTRAMDKLIMLGAVSKTEEDILRKAYRNPQDISGASCYLDAIIPAVHDKVKTVYHPEDEIPAIKSGEEDSKNLTGWIADAKVTDINIYNEIDRRLSYVYPHERQLAMRSKYSVTQLVKGEKSVKGSINSLAVPLFLSGKKGFSAAEKGTIYHKIMEHIDFEEARLAFEEKAQEGLNEYINQKTISLTEKQILMEDEVKQIEPSKIGVFIMSDIGKRAAAAQGKRKLHKEAPFVLKSQKDDGEILVQGIIDCWFEEHDGAVLIDYKTSHLKGSSDDAVAKLKEEYRSQVELYAQAIEQIKNIRVKEKYLYFPEISLTVKI
ncbi:MAG: helicase-exonuclease AddAB subunit AddA [Eubacteriales bacterium]|nr:helicase-exonuclease AddAB subunit AddA [Eubacteriales bacterium]